jgi:DNA-binding MarR family transcriptional regulator
MHETAAATHDEVRLGALANSLGFLLRLAQLTNFSDFYAAFDGTGIRPGEISVLMLIGENPGIRQGVLARRLMIKRAHMAKMIAAMEADGLVEKSVPEADRRGVELRLTPKGHARVAQAQPIFARLDAVSHRGLTPREEQELKRLLRKYLEIDSQSDGREAQP